MNPLRQVQDDFFGKLASEAYFADINLVLLRKLAIQSQIDFALLTTTEKAGRLGVGILVEIPTITADNTNLPAPTLTIRPSVLVAENPLLNTTGKCAEEIATEVILTLGPLAIEGLGTFVAAKDLLTPSDDLEGCVAYRVVFQAMIRPSKKTQCAMPAPSEVNGAIVLTNATAGADIWFTTDGSFPGPGNTPAAQLYNAPLTLAVGTTLRWSAYLAEHLGSNTGQLTTN